MMKLQCAFRAGPRRRWLCRPAGEGGNAVAFAAAAPLLVLAVAVAADRAQVSRFRTQVQLAAGAASLAAAGAIARHPDGDSAGARAASAVFARSAPPGASGKLSLAATNTAAVVTATVGYDGIAPSNFGSALGYAAFHVSASATSHALVADSQTTATP
jgi:hypothetical protein